jgi:hypothetical protein
MTEIDPRKRAAARVMAAHVHDDPDRVLRSTGKPAWESYVDFSGKILAAADAVSGARERWRQFAEIIVATDDESRRKTNVIGGLSLGIGIADCRDNSGVVYQSQTLCDALSGLRQCLSAAPEPSGGE